MNLLCKLFSKRVDYDNNWSLKQAQRANHYNGKRRTDARRSGQIVDVGGIKVICSRYHHKQFHSRIVQKKRPAFYLQNWCHNSHKTGVLFPIKTFVVTLMFRFRRVHLLRASCDIIFVNRKLVLHHLDFFFWTILEWKCLWWYQECMTLFMAEESFLYA